MKQLFSRYSHWLLLFIVGFSTLTMFIDYKPSKLANTASVMGGVGLITVGYLTFVVEKKIRSQRNQK